MLFVEPSVYSRFRWLQIRCIRVYEADGQVIAKWIRPVGPEHPLNASQHSPFPNIVLLMSLAIVWTR